MKIIEEVHDYASADAYINKGRNKVERPLASGLRIKRDNALFIKSPILVYYAYQNNQSIVTYHADGTIELSATGNAGPSFWAARVMTGYSRIRVDAAENMIYDDTTTHTSSKISVCRTCKGSGVKSYWCWEASWCRLSDKELCPHGLSAKDAKPDEHGWHRVNCEHGHENVHRDQSTNGPCNKCSGAKKVDYGSKPIGMTPDWNNPVLIRNGRVVVA